MPSNELINVPTFFNFEIYQTPLLDKTRCHEKNTRISKSDNHWLHRNMRIYKTIILYFNNILKNLKKYLRTYTISTLSCAWQFSYYIRNY